jgi:hypothetical protein
MEAGFISRHYIYPSRNIIEQYRVPYKVCLCWTDD